MPRDFNRFCRPFWITSSGHRKRRWNRNIEENVSNYTVSSVPADELAPLGAKASAGTMMTKFGFHIFMGPAMESWCVVKPLSPQDLWHKSAVGYWQTGGVHYIPRTYVTDNNFWTWNHFALSSNFSLQRRTEWDAFSQLSVSKLSCISQNWSFKCCGLTTFNDMSNHSLTGIVYSRLKHGVAIFKLV